MFGNAGINAGPARIAFKGLPERPFTFIEFLSLEERIQLLQHGRTKIASNSAVL